MTNALRIRQTDEHPPFLPNNFYEAPQYASFRPIRVPFSVPATRAYSHPASVIPAPQKRIRERKTLRTVSVLFSSDGRMTGAKIDLSTGEVQQHDYKNYYDRSIKVRPSPGAADLEPFWMQMPAAAGSTGLQQKKDKSRKKTVNSLKMYLTEYLTLEDALEDLPMLENLITGASLLDLGGNSRPVSCSLLFALLQNLDVITSAAIGEFRGCSPRHSQRLAQCLRVIVTAFDAQASELCTG